MILRRPPSIAEPKAEPIALNAALPGGTLNKNTFNAKSIRGPINGTLLMIGIKNFLPRLNASFFFAFAGIAFKKSVIFVNLLTGGATGLTGETALLACSN